MHGLIVLSVDFQSRDENLLPENARAVLLNGADRSPLIKGWPFSHTHPAFDGRVVARRKLSANDLHTETGEDEHHHDHEDGHLRAEDSE